MLCVDPDGAVLLQLHEWSGRGAPARWLTPGGGIDAGEDEREAALRELWEESGQRPNPAALVGPVRHLRQPTPPGHRYDALDMTTFVWRTSRFDPVPAALDPGEGDAIRALRWSTPDEIAASDEPFDAEDVLGTLRLLTGTVPEPGARVRIRSTKWDGSPHWQYEGIALGTDGHGTWIGVDGPTTTFERPGKARFRGDVRKLTLVPARAEAMLESAWWLPHWYDGGDTALYVDLCSPPMLVQDDEGWVLRYEDLDLDVVRSADGSCWIDDEDELVLHAARFGYPGWVLERVRDGADAMLALALTGAEPGADALAHWWERMDALLPPHR